VVVYCEPSLWLKDNLADQWLNTVENQCINFNLIRIVTYFRSSRDLRLMFIGHFCSVQSIGTFDVSGSFCRSCSSVLQMVATQ